ncbi:MAG: alpha/beta fold hydrolase [Actinomycetia bacterium]|nr:alpha/beta fold hydrolase [Actinomycetes bacterium]
MRRFTIALTAAALLLAACSNDSTNETTNDSTTSATSASTVVETTVVESTVVESTPPASTADPQAFADRPYDVFVPSGYSAATAAPLVILLHGYGATSAIQEAYFKLQPQAEARGFLYVHPDATANLLGDSSWNATDACCQNTAVDDSGYITFIIDEVSAAYNVDPARIYLVGHSNGGFMSYRMACDHADRIAAIVSLAGATFLDAAQCAPTEPVSVLQIHGTDDGTIEYAGGSTPIGRYPSAETTVATWSTYNGCTTATESLGAIDLGLEIDGDETAKQAFTGCPADGAVELWTIDGGPHIPPLTENFAADIIDWLYAHPKE